MVKLSKVPVIFLLYAHLYCFYPFQNYLHINCIITMMRNKFLQVAKTRLQQYLCNGKSCLARCAAPSSLANFMVAASKGNTGAISKVASEAGAEQTAN